MWYVDGPFASGSGLLSAVAKTANYDTKLLLLWPWLSLLPTYKCTFQWHVVGFERGSGSGVRRYGGVGTCGNEGSVT